LSKLARDHARVHESTLALASDRRRAGVGTELDEARAQAQWHSTQARIPELEEQARRAWHRLAVLEGRPASATEPSEPLSPTLAQTELRVPIGLPSELLQRRPDVRKAERELAAATARAGLARTEWFPRFYLTGAAGLESVEASDFLDGGSRFWSLGPSIRWPILHAGRIRRHVEIQDARRGQAWIRYEQAIAKALEDVETALVGFGREQERNHMLREAGKAAALASRLASDRYEAGVTGFQDVLEAQRVDLEAQAGVVESDQTLAKHLIRLYKALGGGWSPVSTAASHGAKGSNGLPLDLPSDPQ